MDLNLFTLSLSNEEKRELLAILKSQIRKIDQANKDKTPIENLITCQEGVSRKLKMILTDYAHNYERGALDRPFPYVDDINKHDFLKLKGAGRKTWDELGTHLERIGTLKSGKTWDTFRGDFTESGT